MKLQNIAVSAQLKALCGSLDKEACGVYAGDLLSWVMSHAQADNIWVTIMSNINVVAVASLTEVACVVLCEGVMPDDGVTAAAEAKGVTLLSSDDTVFGVCKKLCAAGVI